jgi:hypothetical protein
MSLVSENKLLEPRDVTITTTRVAFTLRTPTSRSDSPSESQINSATATCQMPDSCAASVGVRAATVENRVHHLPLASPSLIDRSVTFDLVVFIQWVLCFAQVHHDHASS